MTGTGNAKHERHEHGHEHEWEQKWNDLFPPIDYDALEDHAREAAKVAIDRCWIRDNQYGSDMRSGYWSDEIYADFAWWADILTAAYMLESHALYQPRRMMALLRDPEAAGILHAAMRGRKHAIETRYRRVCYEALKATFKEYLDYTGRLPRATLPPAPTSLPERRKEAR